MHTFVTVIHLVTCFLIVVVVLLQSGKGAEISASFGGSSQTVFGSSGGANFFTRLTLGLATLFMITSLSLTWMSNKAKKSVFEGISPAASSSTTTNPAPAVTPPPPGKPANAADIRGQAPLPPAAPAANAAPAAPVDHK